MSATPRPSLKLTMGKKKAPKPAPENESTPQGEASSETPQPKLTLKIGRKPAGGANGDKPTPKKKASKGESAASKKRREQHRDDEDATGPGSAGPKRIKLIPSKKPGVQSIRIKNKGLVPNRPPGVGYDSEASDTEIDPSIEEQFILRMLPGEDCEYLRQAINERRFDRAEFSFKPLNREGRRAILRIRDKQYAATLVDLPCIIEGMKSWDKRGWYKSADICQMLLVLGPVGNEKEALEYPLPKDVEVVDERTYQYPHGLTPPLKWVRKRRFRERISTRTIEQVEKEVADLIAKDEAALGPPRFELLDTTSLNRAENGVQSGDYYDEYYDDEQDAEGEAEEYAHAEGQEEADFEDDLAAEMEAALAAGADEETVTAKPGAEGIHHAGTPSATKPSSPADTSGDESESEAEGDEGPDENLDEEQLEQQRQLQLKREEIGELEALIKAETDKWEKIQNPILRKKVGARIQSLKQDLALKKVSIGEGEDMDT
ncbi:transcription initiation factor TFIID subunit 7, putative [Paecilomyces variotii No. 5]|uniref:Transcription initiation factor TFIID subunit 7, putative n=1 Tax=Byssochlamys spectabilis (strain No. 5 / NBRC 109023) TaxID=1356009 RepID=V5G3J5_BYSSN|nr:transcription initiation factor TFIID subunit 7, putative [Paecilomyces variotii No. 5]